MRTKDYIPLRDKLSIARPDRYDPLVRTVMGSKKAIKLMSAFLGLKWADVNVLLCILIVTNKYLKVSPFFTARDVLNVVDYTSYYPNVSRIEQILMRLSLSDYIKISHINNKNAYIWETSAEKMEYFRYVLRDCVYLESRPFACASFDWSNKKYKTELKKEIMEFKALIKKNAVKITPAMQKKRKFISNKKYRDKVNLQKIKNGN
jgi:hypothetical protein